MYAIMQWFITVGCLFLGSPPVIATREKTTSKAKVNSKVIKQFQEKKSKSRAWLASHGSHGSSVSIAIPVLGGDKATSHLFPSVEVHTPKTKHPAPQEQVPVDDACSSDVVSHVVTPIKGNRRPPCKVETGQNKVVATSKTT